MRTAIAIRFPALADLRTPQQVEPDMAPARQWLAERKERVRDELIESLKGVSMFHRKQA